MTAAAGRDRSVRRPGRPCRTGPATARTSSMATPTPTPAYTPRNTWDKINVPWKWQPLCVLTLGRRQRREAPARAPARRPSGDYYAGQKPYTPHWEERQRHSRSTQSTSTPRPARPTTPRKSATALKETANLDDTKKVIAEYWADGPRSEFPPGHWALLGQAYSAQAGPIASIPTSRCSSPWATRCWTPASRPGRPSTTSTPGGRPAPSDTSTPPSRSPPGSAPTRATA